MSLAFPNPGEKSPGPVEQLPRRTAERI